MAEKQNSGVTAQIRVKRCYGCGAILQDQYPDEKGYIPPEKFQKDEETLCQRCYKLRHYSTFKEAPSLDNEYIKILNDAKANNDLIVYVLNAFTMDSSIIDDIASYLSDNVIAVINKKDIVSSLIKDNELIEKCEKLLALNNIKAKDILLTSQTNDSENKIEEISKRINQLRDGKSVYFIGVNQVGKSSLVNSLLKIYKNKTDKMITTSPYPGTTLDVISIPLDEESYIYDTPGISNPHSIISHIEPSIARFLLPRERLSVKNETLKPGQSLIISNLFRLDLLDGKKTTFSYYISSDIPAVRINLTKADSYFENLKNEKDNIYLTQKISSFSDMTSTNLISIDSKKNIIKIYGLGVITFTGDSQQIQLYSLNGVKVTHESE